MLALDKGMLMTLNGNTFTEIKGTEKLSDKKIAALTEGPVKGTCLVATSVDGLYLLDGNGLTAYPTGIDDFLRTNQIFSVSHADGKYVFGTVDNGAVIYDVATKRATYINKENSLQNNTVLSSGFDRTGNIWLCLDNGLDYALFSSPVTGHRSDRSRQFDRSRICLAPLRSRNLFWNQPGPLLSEISVLRISRCNSAEHAHARTDLESRSRRSESCCVW